MASRATTKSKNKTHGKTGRIANTNPWGLFEAGHYTNDSEYIHDLIRREQERSAEIEAVRAALIEGEASGEPRPFDAGAFKQRMLVPHG